MRRTATAEPSTTAPPKDPDATLVIGSIGASAGLETMFEKQISIAVGESRTDVDIAGGVFGRDVRLIDRALVDPSSDPAPLVAAFAEQKASAVVTSCGDDWLVKAMPMFADKGIAVVSVNSLSRALRAPEAGASGMLVRLAPTHRCLAKAFADGAWSGDQTPHPGAVTLLAQDTASGHSLADELRARLEPAGGSLADRYFPPGSPDLGGPIDEIVTGQPAVVVIDAGDETQAIISAIATKSLGPDGRPAVRIPLRLTYYNSRSLGDSVPHDAMREATGSRAGGAVQDELVDTMLNIDPSLAQTGFDFAAQAYDAVALIAAAAQSARGTEGARIADGIRDLLSGKGEETHSYEEALGKLREGSAIRYQGRSGPIQLDDDGDPVKVDLTTITYDEAGNAAQENDASIDVSS